MLSMANHSILSFLFDIVKKLKRISQVSGETQQLISMDFECHPSQLLGKITFDRPLVLNWFHYRSNFEDLVKIVLGDCWHHNIVIASLFLPFQGPSYRLQLSGDQAQVWAANSEIVPPKSSETKLQSPKAEIIHNSRTNLLEGFRRPNASVGCQVS